MTVKHECSARIWYRIGWHGDWCPCSRSATVERNGKWYCWQHDPIRVEADKKKRRAADKAKMDRYTARWKRRARNAKLAALVTPELPALLLVLARDSESWAQDNNSYSEEAVQACALAARIREALALEVNND